MGVYKGYKQARIEGNPSKRRIGEVRAKLPLRRTVTAVLYGRAPTAI